VPVQERDQELLDLRKTFKRLDENHSETVLQRLEDAGPETAGDRHGGGSMDAVNGEGIRERARMQEAMVVVVLRDSCDLRRVFVKNYYSILLVVR
jgi:hypothetical protein